MAFKLSADAVGGASPPKFQRLAFLSSGVPDAEAARARLTALYGETSVDQADVVVALGGDGLMLQTLRAMIGKNIPIYGMNRGSIGFLMNDYREDGLLERLAAASYSYVHPLAMRATSADGEIHDALAINEVSMLRQTHQTAKLRISIDGRMRLDELIADGLLVATPAGSTAYNLSANGTILPLNAPLMALTPISAFRPRRWRGALLSDRSQVSIDVLEAGKRPVAAVADHTEFRNVVHVTIEMAHDKSLTLLHDPSHSMEERILREQFGA